MSAEDGSAPLSFRETMDSARDKVVTTLDSARTSFKEKAPPFLVTKVEELEEVGKDYQDKGFYSNWKDFNKEVLSLFKEGSWKDQLMSTLTLKPEDPKAAFIFWIVACFWLGVVDFVMYFLLSNTLVLTGLILALADGFTGYCFAYFFFFTFVCTEKKKYKLLGFVMLAVYTLTVLYFTYAKLVPGMHIEEALVNLLKALFNSIASFHAFKLYKSPTPEML